MQTIKFVHPQMFDGGEIDVASPRMVRIALRDETGFDARCAGVAFVKGGPFPANAPAVVSCASKPDETVLLDNVRVYCLDDLK